MAASARHLLNSVHVSMQCHLTVYIVCRYARRAGLTYQLLTLSEMRAEQPFAPGSELAAELALPNGRRRILTQPDMLVLDMRQPVDPPDNPRRSDPIAVLTPDNLFLATKLLPLISLYLIQDLMETYGDGSDAYLSRVSPCLTWRARWQVAVDKLAPRGNEPGAHEPVVPCRPGVSLIGCCLRLQVGLRCRRCRPRCRTHW